MPEGNVLNWIEHIYFDLNVCTNIYFHFGTNFSASRSTICIYIYEIQSRLLKVTLHKLKSCKQHKGKLLEFTAELIRVSMKINR